MKKNSVKKKFLAVLVLIFLVVSINLPVISAQNNQPSLGEFKENSFTGFIDFLQKIIDYIISLFSNANENQDQGDQVTDDTNTDDEEKPDDQTDEDNGTEEKEGEDETEKTNEDENIPPPDIDVVKQVKKENDNQYYEEVDIGINEIVNFSITVTNNDFCTYKLNVKDILPDGLLYCNNAYVDGVLTPPDIDGNNYTWVLFVEVQESSVITFEAEGSICDSFTNIVNVTDYFECEEIFIEDEAYVNVICGEPSINCMKTVTPDFIDYGETVIWNITVENTGTVALYDVIVEDSLMGLIDTIPFLDVNCKKYYEYTTIPESDTTNCVEVKGYDDIGTEVSDSDCASVEVLFPCPPEVWVDDSWYPSNIPEDLIWGYNAFNIIQDAIDVVCECGTIHVKMGNYYGQILINKSLELLAEPGAKIYASGLDSFTLDGNPELYKPVIFAYAGTLVGANVETSGNIGVKIDGFEIHAGNIDDVIAILYHNVQTTCIPNIISNNTILDPYIAIQIDGCSTDTTIVHNKISYPGQTSDRIGILITSNNEQCMPTNVEINYNYIYGAECAWNIGIWNKVDTMIEATLNWWANDDGPASADNEGGHLDPITSRPADGYGDRVIGNVHFDPWWGVDAKGSVTHIVGNMYMFDASASFAYDETGDITENLDYWWKFDDGSYSSSKQTGHTYSESGGYYPILRVKLYSYDLDLDPGYLLDYSYFHINI